MEFAILTDKEVQGDPHGERILSLQHAILNLGKARRELCDTIRKNGEEMPTPSARAHFLAHSTECYVGRVAQAHRRFSSL